MLVFMPVFASWAGSFVKQIIKWVRLRSSSKLYGRFKRKNKPPLKAGTVSKVHRVISHLTKNTPSDSMCSV